MLRNVVFFFLYSMDNRKCFQAGFQQPSCFDIENILAQSNNHAEIAVINCSIYRNVNNIYVLLVVLWTKSMCGLVFKKNDSGGRTWHRERTSCWLKLPVAMASINPCTNTNFKWSCVWDSRRAPDFWQLLITFLLSESDFVKASYADHLKNSDCKK